MMDAMHDDPAGGRLLQVADAEQGEHVLKPQRAFVAAMREQPMEAGADAHRAEDVVSDRQPQQAPPAEDVRQRTPAESAGETA